MGKKPKIVAVLPAYNAAKTLRSFVDSLPNIFDEIILIDDRSKDTTFKIAQSLSNLTTQKNLNNLGYGGNLKKCLDFALNRGADIMVEIHPDAEYGVNGIKPALAKIKQGTKLVLGNRFASPKPSGMFFWKIPVTKFLTLIGNLVLGTSIPDLHQGFRVYSRELLKQIDYKHLSDDYIFSFEIIALAVFKKVSIGNVPVSVHYQGKKRGASFSSSVKYSLEVLLVLLNYNLANLGWKRGVFLDQ